MNPALRTPLVLLSAGLFLASARGAARQEQRPVFRSDVLSVLVDVVVLDRDNRVVSDLSVEDFVLYENGVEQVIDTLQFRRPVSASAAGSGETPNRVEEGRTDPGPNLIVLLLDYATTPFENQRLVRDASIKYVRERLRPNDYVGVFGLGAAFRYLQEFTNDRDLLIEALSHWDGRARGLEAGPRGGPALGASGAQTLASAGPVEIAGATPAGMAAAGRAAGAAGSDLADLMFARRIEEMYYTMSAFTREREARSVMTAIQAIARGLEPVQGRKTLVLFSRGFVVGANVEYQLEKTVNLANRANLAIYGIDSSGLTVGDLSGDLLPRRGLEGISSAVGESRINSRFFDQVKESGSGLRDSALRYVATATGGFAVRHTNDLFVGMERVDDDIRSYYLLSYRPRNQEFDGSFREIRVEVKREGLSARHRSGYLAVPAGMEGLAGEEYRLLARARSGRVNLDLPASLRLDTFRGPDGGQQVLVTVELAGRGLVFAPEENEEGEPRRSARLNIIGLVRDGQGQTLQRFGTPVNLHATPEEHEVLSRGSITFNHRVQLLPAVYSFQLLVQDRSSGRAALEERSLRLDPPGEELGLSTIVVGRDVEQARGGEFLTVGGTRIVPAARREFQNGDKLVFFFEIYNFERDRSLAPRLEAEVTLQHPGGGQVRLPEIVLSTPLPAEADRAPVARYVELKGLSPGPYFLRVQVRDRLGGGEVEARTAFSLVR